MLHTPHLKAIGLALGDLAKNRLEHLKTSYDSGTGGVYGAGRCKL
jgi:hypothetical protein